MRPLIYLFFLLLQQGPPSPTPSPTPPIGAASSNFWVNVATIAAPIVAVIIYLHQAKTFSWIKARFNRFSVKKLISGLPHSDEELEEAFRYFVPPKCCDDAPPDGEAPTSSAAARRLFDSLDEKLTHPTTYKYLILLGESGMGKTTALINYCLRHARRLWGPKFGLKFVSLCFNGETERMIEGVSEKSETVLVLDGLDENELAIIDCAEYIRMILEATADFRGVLISCRTHFFPKDEAIPSYTGVPVTGPLPPGQGPEHCFHRIYLLPFNDQQVKKYLSRRYPFWRRRERKRVFDIIKNIPHLTARPMLLAYTPVLVQDRKEFRCSYELYEVMVKAWLVRERFIKEREPSSLIEFSEQLAVDLHLKRESRKSDKISEDELTALAREWGFEIETWKLRGRSLLSRDPAGNIKFADPSVMEYLFVSRFFRGDPQTLGVEWSEQMHVFHWEWVVRNWEKGRPWFMPEPFKLLLEHPRGIDTLVKSHALCARRGIEDFTTEKWDEFGVSVIAYMLYTAMLSTAEYLKPLIMLKRIKSVFTSETLGEKRVTFVCRHGAMAQYGEGLSGENVLYYNEAGGNSHVRDYKGNFSEVKFADGEEVKELPREAANSFFTDSQSSWMRRAFRIRTDRGSDVVLALQTTAEVDEALAEKIVRCARALF